MELDLPYCSYPTAYSSLVFLDSYHWRDVIVLMPAPYAASFSMLNTTSGSPCTRIDAPPSPASYVSGARSSHASHVGGTSQFHVGTYTILLVC
jgi:hypothetical protein